MATLILTAVGTAIGGPFGGALGALVGRQIDGAVLGSGGRREGPRLKDLAVTTSSYGQPIARHFGSMRVPGTIIWATDLRESKETSGGGKGKPKTTTYSYSASFAVALSSRAIVRIGKVWADGNLLRGANGDLKTGGEMRSYLGHGDAAADPLIAAAEGSGCPAFRDCAYVVFEDLKLADFGNRLPALTFEVEADATSQVDLAQLTTSRDKAAGPPVVLPHVQGFSDEGGEIGGTLSAIDQLFPLDCNSTDLALDCSLVSLPQVVNRELPEAIEWQSGDSDSGRKTFEHRRDADSRPQPRALRYYDAARDYQPGIQRSVGQPAAGREVVLEFAGTLDSSGARAIVTDIAHRARVSGETILWRMAELDLSLRPGKAVRVPDQSGIWTIKSWEWLDRGVEVLLERVLPSQYGVAAGDPGGVVPPSDLTIPPTYLQAFELPWDGTTPSDAPVLMAATSASGAGWKGAQLYVDQAGALIPIGSSGSKRAVIGTLNTAIEPSQVTRVDRGSAIELELFADDLSLPETTIAGLAAGTNRLLIGDELVQFLYAEQTGPTTWTLTGILRGRGGTEASALTIHAAGTSVALLDDALTPLDRALVPSDPSTQIAAIGLGDPDPVYTNLANSGLTRRPLCPVHGRASYAPNGDLTLCWTRRGRGQWRWDDFVETALVEEREAYLVGYGPVDGPHASWETAEPNFTIDAVSLQDLRTAHGPSNFHVRHLGTYGRSDAVMLAAIT